MGVVSSTIRINDAFSGALNRLSNGLAQTQRGFGKLKSALGGNLFGGAEKSSGGFFRSMVGGVAVGNLVSRGVGLAGQAIHSMIGELTEASTSWQTFEGNMAQLGKSPEQINSAEKEMQQFAQQSIYSASDMASTYSQLAAVGVKNVGSLVKGFGGLASSADNPKQAMKTLSQQATQMAAKPTVQWQDFKLMLEQTPAGIAAVAKSMHKTTTQLVQDVQDGNIKTQDFFNAISKTGTNKYFSKMATQYKTVGQAVAGLKETLANKLKPTFDKVGKIGIKWVEQIIDRLDSINFDAIGDTLAGAMKKIDIGNIINNISNSIEMLKPIFEQASFAVKSFIAGFKMSGVGTSLSTAFSSIVHAITNVMSALNGAGKGTNFANMFGQISGKAITAVANGITTVANAIANMNPGTIRAIAGSILALVASLKALKVASNIGEGLSGLHQVFSGVKTGFSGMHKELGKAPAGFVDLSKSLGTAKNDIQGAFALFKEGGFSSIGELISGAVSPVGLAIAGITTVIIGGVMAWQDNFLGFKDVMTGIFTNLGTIFQPLFDAFNNLGQAFQPLFSALQRVGQVVGPVLKGLFEGISVVAIMGVVTAIAAVADVIKNLINAATILPNAVKAIVQGFHAIGDALKGNFSGAKKDIADAKEAIGNIKGAIKGLGDFKITNGVFKQMSKFKLNSPKVKQPKVPNPKMPKALKTMAAPKIKQPKVPTPKMPKSIKNISAPKIKRPVVPSPKMPKVKNIPAPKVGRPNMNGVVSAVSSGMSRAASAARAGGGKLSAAVRSAVAQAAAAGRAGAGAMFSVGAMIGQGLASGLQSQIGAVAAAASALVAQAERATRAAAKVHSPSRVWMAIGSFIGQGLANGITSTGAMVANASAGIINDASNITPTINRPSFVAGRSDGFTTSGLSADSVVRSNSISYGNSNSQTVNIQPGAILVNSVGNPEQDADIILERLERKLLHARDKALSY